MARWYEPLTKMVKSRAAQYIWATDVQRGMRCGRTDLVMFHGVLRPPVETRRMELRVMAEGRYTLWINEEAEALGRGTARSDVFHRQVDAYELACAAGETPAAVDVWAQVRWFVGMPEAPMGESFAAQPVFLAMVRYFDGAGTEIGVEGTTSTWEAYRSGGIACEPITSMNTFFCTGQSEAHKAGEWPEVWRKALGKLVADGGWTAAAELGSPHFKGDPEIPWSPNGQSWLIEREIAPVEQEPLEVRNIRVVRGGATEKVGEARGIKLAAHERVVLRCDMGAQMNGHIRLGLKGKGTAAQTKYAEVLVDHKAGKKSFDLESGLELWGFADRFELDVDAFVFETHHWRALRFLEVTVTAGPEGAEIQRLEVVRTGYPFAPDFRVAVEGPLQETIRKIVEVSWRTLKCCTYETYMDCPYYEQMQYVGDTRIQALITYVTTGDPTLPAQALRAFDRSRIYEGITASRAPGTGPQYIPTFSLIYIMMIEDYFINIGDDALVAELRPGIAPILNWFTKFMDPDTLLIGLVDYWPFVDWVQGWEKGIAPHGGRTNASAAVNLLYLLALQAATRIYDAAKPGSGNIYAGRATALKQRIFDTFYDPQRGLMCDIPLEAGRGIDRVWSQHAQALAVLADVLVGDKARKAMETALEPQWLFAGGDRWKEAAPVEGDARFINPASFYFRFYVAEALAKLRMGQLFWPLMEPFREALARGSTVWPESFEPSRSECHAWSSWPLYFLARHTLGIAPPSADDQVVRISPLHCAPLDVVDGRFQTYRGAVDVAVDWRSKRLVKASGAGVRIMEEPSA